MGRFEAAACNVGCDWVGGEDSVSCSRRALWEKADFGVYMGRLVDLWMRHWKQVKGLPAPAVNGLIMLVSKPKKMVSRKKNVR